MKKEKTRSDKIEKRKLEATRNCMYLYLALFSVMALYSCVPYWLFSTVQYICSYIQVFYRLQTRVFWLIFLVIRGKNYICLSQLKNSPQFRPTHLLTRNSFLWIEYTAAIHSWGPYTSLMCFQVVCKNRKQLDLLGSLHNRCWFGGRSIIISNGMMKKIPLKKPLFA